MDFLSLDLPSWLALAGMVVVMAVSVAVASGIAGARIRTAREDAVELVDQSRREGTALIQRLEARVGSLERQLASMRSQPMPEAARAATHPSATPSTEARPPPAATLAGPEPLSQGALTREALAALDSVAAFRRFAGAVGGNGLMLRGPGEAPEWITGSDPASTADLWAVEHAGQWLIYPGYGLRRAQSALLADAGRVARDRLDWMFEIRTGDQLAAEKPAVMAADGQVVERGRLRLPL